MDPKPIVVLNCRSRHDLRPGLVRSLQSQTIRAEVKILESLHAPQRLNQINDENSIYFFFDHDVELPHAHYIQDVLDLFVQNPGLNFLGGKYLSTSKQNYLAKSYNVLIEFWMFQEKPKMGLINCQNIPGGVWIIRGTIAQNLASWVEPTSWAGEDTFSIRWLQQQRIKTYYHNSADVYHFPNSNIWHFCRRAFLQGQARKRLRLESDYSKFNWSLFFKFRFYWPGWFLHQAFVEIGSLSFKIKSRIANTTPTTSPIA